MAGEGRLRKSVINTVGLILTYDGADLVAEYDDAGTLKRRYVHGPGVDEPLVVYEGTTTTAKNWLYKDHLGSVIGTADATGTSTAIYSYGPYGEPNTTTGQRFRYTGQQLIKEIGLYYYKARFYSPALGRFLQTDPIGTADDLNLYAYVGNNPVNFGDPTRLSSQETAQLNGKLTDSSNEVQSWQVAGFRTPDKDNILLEGSGGGGVPGINIGGGAGRGGVNPIGNGSPGLGKFANKSIPARSPARDFTAAERAEINAIRSKTACQTCGTTSPGTKTGNFVPDHQPSSALNVNGEPQRLYPHCITGSRQQGLDIARQRRQGGE